LKKLKKRNDVLMDNFESYLFNKISDYQKKLTDNKGNKEVEWCLNNCIDEFIEILSEYNLNYKYDLGA